MVSGRANAPTLSMRAIAFGAEYILITECGHANRSLVYEGPYMAGYKDGKPPVKIKHFVQLVYEYLRDGRIRIDPQKKLKVPVTYQDPCNISRNCGLWEVARQAIACLAEDFRDMSPNRDYNHPQGISQFQLRQASQKANQTSRLEEWA